MTWNFIKSGSATELGTYSKMHANLIHKENEEFLGSHLIYEIPFVNGWYKVRTF